MILATELNPLSHEIAGSNRGLATNIICSFGGRRLESETYAFPKVAERPLQHVTSSATLTTELAGQPRAGELPVAHDALW